MPRGGKLLGKIPSKSGSHYRSSTPASTSSRGQEVSTAVTSVLSELHSLITQIQVYTHVQLFYGLIFLFFLRLSEIQGNKHWELSGRLTKRSEMRHEVCSHWSWNWGWGLRRGEGVCSCKLLNFCFAGVRGIKCWVCV